MSCGVDHRSGSVLALLWLWHRLAAAALIGPLAWESSYAMGAALKRQTQQQQQQQQQQQWIQVPIWVSAVFKPEVFWF